MMHSRQFFVFRFWHFQNTHFGSFFIIVYDECVCLLKGTRRKWNFCHHECLHNAKAINDHQNNCNFFFMCVQIIIICKRQTGERDVAKSHGATCAYDAKCGSLKRSEKEAIYPHFISAQWVPMCFNRIKISIHYK